MGRSAARAIGLLAAAVLLAAAAVAAWLVLRDLDDEPGWTSASGRVIDRGSCNGGSAADFDFPPLRDIRDSRPGGSIRHVSLRGWDGSVVGTGEYYEVELADETRRQIARDWRVKGRMLALDEEGDVLEEVSHDRIEPSERMISPQMKMRIGDEPGLYRLEVRISGAGPRSGLYAQRIEAVPPRGEGRLAISGRTFRAGEALMARIENLGSEPIQYGEAMWLERRVGGQWRPLREEGLFQLWAAEVPGGEAGRCEAFKLEPGLDPGPYRLVKDVSTREYPRGWHDHLITAEFEVVD